jgi:hypothetical protein
MWSIQRADHSTSIELALDRSYPGLVVTVGELGESSTFDDLQIWTRRWASSAFNTAWGPDLIGASRPLPLLADAPADVPRVANADRRFVQLHFLDHDPEHLWSQGWALFGGELESSGLATHLWTAPFIQTEFGTDRYTDELW